MEDVEDKALKIFLMYINQEKFFQLYNLLNYNANFHTDAPPNISSKVRNFITQR